MNPLLLALLIAVAGGAGAAVRFVVDGAIQSRRRPGAFPVGLFVVNVTGALALGFIAGYSGRGIAPEWAGVLGTGFLGGYTTFSAASLETVRLYRTPGRRSAVVGASVGMLLAAILAAAVGFFVAVVLPPYTAIPAN